MESMEERLNKLKSRMSSLGLTDDDSEDNFSYTLSFIDVVRDRINEDSKNEYGFTKNDTESSFYSILSVIESMQDVFPAKEGVRLASEYGCKGISQHRIRLSAYEVLEDTRDIYINISLPYVKWIS